MNPVHARAWLAVEHALSRAWLLRSVARTAGLVTGSAMGPAAAHEAWLLTPSEVAELSRMPLPPLFTDPFILGLAGAAAGCIAVAALRLETIARPHEARLATPLREMAGDLGPLVLRLALAVMLVMAALGGLPRHGTHAWTQPTLMVPDMQLALAPGWEWLVGAQVVLALFLFLGFLTRLAGLALAGIAVLGIAAFGAPFEDYAPHFVAPGLMLAVLGGGSLTLDRTLGFEDWLRPTPRLAQIGWTAAIALLGGGFVYLAVTYKLTQPTLLIAILEHGGVPTFGIPIAIVSLLMMMVELGAGILLAFGRLVRPIALLLIGAFTFFALTLGEPPVFHANLYGSMFVLFLSGGLLPDGCFDRSVTRAAQRQGS